MDLLLNPDYLWQWSSKIYCFWIFEICKFNFEILITITAYRCGPISSGSFEFPSLIYQNGALLVTYD